MIIFLSILQIILSIIISSAIIFSKSSGNFNNSITNNFTGGSINTKSINLRPRTKLMLLFVFILFANSIFLTKEINKSYKTKNSLFISNKLNEKKINNLEQNTDDIQVKKNNNINKKDSNEGNIPL
jgi:hypothetical protein